MSKENVSVVQNKAVFFVLPMLQLNKSSFGADNFITCMLDKSGYIVINTKEEIKNNTDSVFNHENFVTDYKTRDKTINYVFTVPDEHIEDARLFADGKYSQLSAKLKINVAKTPNISAKITNMLNPQINHRQELADSLGVKVDLIKELASAPGESNFIKIK